MPLDDSPTHDTPEVLIALIDDDPAPEHLLAAVAAQSGFRCRVWRLNSRDTLQLLTQATAEDTPRLVLLEWKLAGTEPLRLIEQLKTGFDRRIPVIVFAAWENKDDVAAAYDVQANCWVVKPASPDEYARTVAQILHFWLRDVRLPVPMLNRARAGS